MYWPTTLLSRDIADARILSFGYDADIVNFWNSASQNRLGNHAENMLGALARRREQTNSASRISCQILLVITISLGRSKDHICSTQSWRLSDRGRLVLV